MLEKLWFRLILSLAGLAIATFLLIEEIIQPEAGVTIIIGILFAAGVFEYAYPKGMLNKKRK